MAQGQAPNTNGQKPMSKSAPVVVAGDQTPIPTQEVAPIQVINQFDDRTPFLHGLTDAMGNPIDSTNGALFVNVRNLSQLSDGSTPVAGQMKQYVFNFETGVTGSTDPIDVSQYKSIYVGFGPSTAVHTFNPEVSADGINWTAGYLVDTAATLASNSASAFAFTLGITSVRNWGGPVVSKFFRIRFSSMTAATRVIIQLQPFPFNPLVSATISQMANIGVTAVVVPSSTATTGAGTMPSVIYTTLNEGTFANNSLNQPLTYPTKGTEGSFSPPRMSANRSLYGQIRDASGNERGANVTPDNSLQTKDGALGLQEEAIGTILQQILDAINALPNIQPKTDDNLKRLVTIVGTTPDNIDTANLTITASVTKTTLFTPPQNMYAHLRSIVLNNTAASGACTVTLTDGVRTYTFTPVGSAGPVGISGGGSVLYPSKVRGGAWSITCGTSVSSIVVDASFELSP